VQHNDYATNGLLASSTDALGTVTAYRYDAVNRVVERRTDPKALPDGTSNPEGLDLVCTYEFDAFGQQITVTHGKDDLSNPANVADRTTFEYDLAGRIKHVVVDPNGLELQTSYEYDGLGDVLAVSQGTKDDPDQLVTRYEFDDLGRRVRQVAVPSSVFGAGSASERDLTTTYKYDDAGRLSRVIDANGASTWFVHDAAGQLLQTLDSLGSVVENRYDGDGRLIETRAYAEPVDVEGFGDVVDARVAVEKTQEDQRRMYVYNDDGQQRFVAQAEHDGQWSISETRFDAAGNVAETIRYDRFMDEADVEAMDAEGAAGVSMDEMSDELATLGYDGSDTSLAQTQLTRFSYDADNRLRFVVDAYGGVTESVYDDAGRRVSMVRYATPVATGDVAEGTLDHAVDRTDFANQITDFSYDRAGRLRFTVQVLATDGAGHATRQIVSEQRYDALGRVTDAIAYATEVHAVAGYDEATLASSVASSVADRHSAFVYDAAGRVVRTLQALSSLDAQNHPQVRYAVQDQAFDAMGRVVRTTSYAKTAASIGASPEVDPVNDRTTSIVYDEAGRERFVVAPDGSFSETIRDAMGRVKEQRQFAIAVPAGIAITESALAMLRAQRSVGDGATRGTTYTRDAVGRVLLATDGEGLEQAYEYNALGQVVFSADRNGDIDNSTRVSQFRYDRLGRITDSFTPGIPVIHPDGYFSYTELHTEHEYDAFGNVKTINEAAGWLEERTTRYEYDRLGRVVTVTLPGVFDEVEGRIRAPGEPTDGEGVLRTIDTTYDALGNAVRVATRTGVQTFQVEYHTYDNLGRDVDDVDAMGEVTSSTYDAFGDRVAITRHAAFAGLPPDGLFGHWTVDTLAAALGTRPDDQIVRYAYDTMARLRFTVDATGA